MKYSAHIYKIKFFLEYYGAYIRILFLKYPLVKLILSYSIILIFSDNILCIKGYWDLPYEYSTELQTQIEKYHNSTKMQSCIEPIPSRIIPIIFPMIMPIDEKSIEKQLIDAVKEASELLDYQSHLTFLDVKEQAAEINLRFIEKISYVLINQDPLNFKTIIYNYIISYITLNLWSSKIKHLTLYSNSWYNNLIEDNTRIITQISDDTAIEKTIRVHINVILHIINLGFTNNIDLTIVLQNTNIYNDLFNRYLNKI